MKPPRIFDATLPVTLKGTGCVWCPALRYRAADEQRFCVVSGEVLEDWRTQRGESCALEGVEERD